MWVRPDHQLTVRQSVAPLDRTMEIVGQAVPAAGEELLHINAAGIGDEQVEPTTTVDWFAPAQFEVLGRSEKLSRASFEEMNAGVTFGHPGAAVTSRPDELTTSVDTGYEEDSLTDSVDAPARPGYTLRRHADVAAPAFSIAPTAYTLVQAADGTEAGLALADRRPRRESVRGDGGTGGADRRRPGRAVADGRRPDDRSDEPAPGPRPRPRAGARTDCCGGAMTAELYFLPWLRRGLGIELGEPDTGQVELPRGAPVPAWVELDGVPAAVSLSLRPPDHVTGIDDAQIVRRYPEPNTVDAEYGYFPLIEFSASDFPWVLTPAVANEAVDGRLRPWVVLVCVEEAMADYVAGDGDGPGRLLCPVPELPNLDESYAWAHVQSVAAPSEVVDQLAVSPGSVIARLVCPRRLDPLTRYRAAVVGAFAVADDHLVAAWDSRTPKPDLTVFATWTFTTGEAGSFEELCRRLGPIDDTQLQLGMHPLDVTVLGAVDPWPEGTARVIVDYTGALWDADLAARGLGELKEDFDTDVTKLLDQGSEHVTLDLNDPDPVVTPPLYGSFPAVTHEVPGEGWLRQLNLAPNRRAAAGLGADVVRQHQERFMALAWRQAGALRETNRELSVTRLQAEIGRTWRHRANRLEDLPRVTVLRPQLTFVRDADSAPAATAARRQHVPRRSRQPGVPSPVPTRRRRRRGCRATRRP